MTVTVNGQATELPEGATVADVVARLGHDPQQPGVAVAVDGQVVRRLRWADTPVRAGQRLEVLTAVQGGSR